MGCSQTLKRESQGLPPAYLLPSSCSFPRAAAVRKRWGAEPRSRDSPVLEKRAKARSKVRGTASHPAQLRNRYVYGRVEVCRVKEPAKGRGAGSRQPYLPHCRSQFWPHAPDSRSRPLKSFTWKQLDQPPAWSRRTHSVGKSYPATGEKGSWEQFS